MNQTISVENIDATQPLEVVNTYTFMSEGSTDYNLLANKPSINGVVLEGNKTSAQLNIKQSYTADEITSTGTTNQFVTTVEKAAWNSKSDFSGSYSDLTDKPIIPTDVNDLTDVDGLIPTTLADLTDDETHRLVTDVEKGVWNAKQDALGFTPENIANKGMALGYASLDGGGKIPMANLPSTVLHYIGTWNAEENLPELVNPAEAKAGHVYTISVPGTRFGIEWKLGDWLIYNAAGIPEKSDNSDDVTSVNGKTGIVVLNTNDITESSEKLYVSTAEKSAWNGKQDVLGYTPENIANKKLDLTDNSDTYYPSQKAVKTAVDAKIAKATNVTAINDTNIADGEIVVFNLTNKDMRTSDKTIVTTLGTTDTTVPTSKAVMDAIDAAYGTIMGGSY